MIFETSWDDGSIADLRIVSLLQQYDLPGTFFIPAERKLNWASVKLIAEQGFKIGSHTVNHPQDLKMLEDDFLWFEIDTSKGILETVLRGIQNEVDEFCYPRGRYNNTVIAQVEKSGYKSARTTKVLVTDLSWQTTPFEKPTTIHVYDKRSEYGGQKWDELAQKLFRDAKKRGDQGYFHLWGHADEISKNNDWQRLENFLKWVKEQGVVINGNNKT